MQQVVDRQTSVNEEIADNTRQALIYTRMGVVFRAHAWTESTYGINAEGVWSTPGQADLEVFLPWTSVDSIRFS